MDKATLVGLDVETGARIVSVLEDAGIAVKVALWMVTSEYEAGRLVLASSSLDQVHPLRAYETVFEILHGKFVHETPLLLVLRMRDPFIQSWRQLFSKTESVEGMRLGGQMIGNRFIEDGYVYRIR
ncbi:MAG TPA: hypothetical protein VFC39_02485 [Acidobacteriaceae bacterium]|nr:hypothetical protein [Acidobacteriaceae bacterium]